MTMSFIKLRMCLRIGKRSLTGGAVRGSSIDRKERSLRRPRLNGALRGKTNGDAGSPVWDWRLSEDPPAPCVLRLLEGPASPDAEKPRSCARGASPVGVPASAPSGVWEMEGLGWKSASDVETDWRRGAAQVPSPGLEASCSGGEFPPVGRNLKRNKLLLMQISAGKRRERKKPNQTILLILFYNTIAILTKWLHRNLILSFLFFLRFVHFTHKVALFHLQLSKRTKMWGQAFFKCVWVILKAHFTHHPRSDAVCKRVDLHDVFTKTALTAFRY